MLFSVLKDDIMQYFKKRGNYALIVVVVLCFILLSRLAYLQIFNYETLIALSERNRIRVQDVRADRGFIKDRNGFLIVRNAPGYELEVIKEDTPDIEHLLNSLSQVVDFNPGRAMQQIKHSRLYEPVRIARGVSLEKLSYLMQHSSSYAGLQFVVAPTRSYIDGETLSHTLGYLAEVTEREVVIKDGYKSGDIVGRNGIENEFDKVLRGKDGQKRVEVDNVGRVMEVLSEEPAVPGKNLMLTIDYQLQKYAAELLDGRVGSIVVMDVDDSSLLTMYSAPTYDLGMFSPFITDKNWKTLSTDPKTPLLNRPIEGAYPPGSVFKVLVAMAALKEGLITPETKFHCQGQYKFSPRSNIVHNCWKHRGHGEISLKRALSESCDVYFYNVGVLLGIDKLSEYAIAHGLGRLTGLSLPNEKTGVFPSREWKERVRGEPWYPGETVNVSIGQGDVTSTPLQVASMYSSLFNGGIAYAPRIVDAIEDPITGITTRLSPTVMNRDPIDVRIRNIVMQGLVMGVEDRSGTAWRARVNGVSIGGKTGTAQVISMRRVENLSEDQIPERWRDHSWFAGVFPSERPKYVIVVMIEHGGSGGRSSAPIGSLMVNKMLELGYVTTN